MIGRKSQGIQILKRVHAWGGGLAPKPPPLAPDKLPMLTSNSTESFKSFCVAIVTES